MDILKILKDRDRISPDAMALYAPGRTPCFYSALHAHVVRTATALCRRGISRDDIVAVMLPNGPEMATAFLSVSVGAVCAPLNPAYRADELQFYLSDLPAKALIIAGLADSPAREVARELGIPVIELEWSPEDPAGLFNLAGTSDHTLDDRFEAPHADDIALVLHTSGTTSRPKIVPLTHVNLAASARHIAATLELTPADLCLNVMPLFHIHGLVAALLASLEAGASVVCTPGFLAPSFFDWVKEFGPTWYTAVPTMHASILSRADANQAAMESHKLRFIRSSSAALPRTTLAQLEEVFGVPVIEAYGMTEAAHQMASNPLAPGVRKPGTVGRAAGPCISVLDGEGQPLPAGVRGEIAIKGLNVTAGYVRNNAANAAAFINGWLRTGDEGTLDDEGYLTILGRLKEVINRGGEKISPLEVDEVLMAHPAVAQAVTFAAADTVLGEEVAAALVLRDGMTVSERQIREFVAVRLAHFKVPRRVLFLPSIPLGPTGKLQRIGLAERLGVSFDAPEPSAAEYVAPRSPVEEVLASIWSSVLATEPPGVHENFFYSGGDSILAAQFVARVRDTLAVEMSLLSFFDSPTVAGVASVVEESLAARYSCRIPRSSRTDSSPLSFGQQMVWLSTQLDKTTPAYNRCAALRITGRVDREVLQRALTAIVERHEILRSRIATENGAPMARSFAVGRIPLPVTDLSTLPVEERSARVGELLDAEARRPFDLDTGPLLRAGIFDEADEAATLYITTHHIASDGWSDGVMFRELNALYGAFLGGEASPLPAVTTEYRDYAAWVRQVAEEPEGKRHAAYWRKRLAGAPAMQELPADHPRPDIPGMLGGQVTLEVSPALAQSLASIGRQEGATLAMTTFAAFQLLQSRLTGQPDTVVGLSLAGRTHSDVEALIGLFNCVVPLRVTVDRQMTFRELLGAVRIAVLEAHEHQDVPVDEILEALPSARGVRHADIAQTLFNFRNMPAFPPSLPGLTVQSIPTFNGSSVADLELEVVEDVAGWKCDLRFRTDLYEEATARRLLGHYLTLLESIANNPDERIGSVQLLTRSERSRILSDFNSRVCELPAVLQIHGLIQEQAAKTPHAVAVQCETGELTYDQLDKKANAFAHDLRSRGVAPGSLFGICMERSLEMVVALIGILKSGGAFVPFDPDYPRERLTRMLADAKPVVLLADETGASLLGKHDTEMLIIDEAYLSALANADDPPLVDHDPRAVACVLYTSGSTGLPKGVLSTHRGIVNNLLDVQRMYGLTPDACVLHQTSLGFDAAAWEIFWPLTVGARIYLARPGGQRDAEYVVQTITDQRIGTVGFAPSMLKVMLDMPRFTQCEHIERVMAYGQVLSPGLQENLFTRMPNTELHNLYGPTEASITVTAWQCERRSARRSVPIGRPMMNAEIYILDAGLEPVPIGVAGEIYIGGVCVSNGYHDRPDLTAERFLPHPFRPGNGERVYRTGDIARFSPDGVIEYIGRRDNQLKIRGVRVELEEVEAALDRLPEVKESVVVSRADADGEPRLIAYVAVDDGAGSPLELRRALENELPLQFIPALVIPLNDLPHGPNGKVDRAALPDPSSFLTEPAPALETPGTWTERRLARIWKELLGVTEIGTRDSFFDLGGHSLLAVRMLQRVADEIGEVISLRAFYDEPTIHAVANLLTGNAPVAKAGDLPSILKVREGSAWPPLFYLNGQPPGGGHYAKRLTPYLPADQGLYIIPVPIFESPITVEGMAARMIELIRSEQAEGPYLLAGNCFGATLALEIAQQLHARGERVALVALIHPEAQTPRHFGFRVMKRVATLGGIPKEFHIGEFSSAPDYVLRTLREIWRELRRLSPRQRVDRAKEASRWITGFVVRSARKPLGIVPTLRRRMPRDTDEQIQDRMRQDWLPVPEADQSGDQTADEEMKAHERYLHEAWNAYVPRNYAGPATIIWPAEGGANPPWDPRRLWERLTPALDWQDVPGNHYTILHEHLEHSARALGDSIEKARSR